MIYLISLSLVPTAMVGLNERLKMPKNFVVRSEARPSLFAYPEPIKPVSKDEKKDVGPKVQLSTTIKRQTSRALRKVAAGDTGGNRGFRGVKRPSSPSCIEGDRALVVSGTSGLE